MINLDFVSFPELLRISVPGFDSVYDEHVRDYDEVLPHVLVGDLVRFLLQEVRTHGAGSTALRAAMDLLEQAMSSDDQRLQELVAVSFLENLDPEDPGFTEISTLFGSSLRAEYIKYATATRET